MKRRLIIMRHAKSSWKDAGQTDHQRPLNKRGKRSAPLVAQRIVELDWTPDWVVSSDAQRTRETYELMSTVFDSNTQVALFQSLYLGDVFALQEVIAELPDDVGTVLALGHNPGWSAAVHWLSGEFVEMTTANAVLLEGEGDAWSTATTSEKSWQLIEVIRPRDFE